MRPKHALFALFLMGCAGETTEEGVCHDMCTELTGTCGYASFPDINSCVQGCEYNATQGADIAGQSPPASMCAQCDTFAIMECEHAFGLD